LAACNIKPGSAIENKQMGAGLMSGEAKTLKQVEAAQSVIEDVLALLETFSPRWADRETENRFVEAAMAITRRRLQEVHSELASAFHRARMSPENTTIVSKELFEDVRLFRAIGPAQLSSLLKNRRLRRSLQELDEAKQDLSEGTTSTGL
jgi:hypothetical protein